MRTFAPSGYLRGVVKYFWAFEGTGGDDAEKTFSAIVDGCPGVIMVQSQEDRFCDVGRGALPEIFLYGQTEKPVRFLASGRVGAVGICFHPHALKSVFGMDAHELTNGCTDLNLLGGKKQDRLSERLFDVQGTEARIDLLSHYLTAQVQRNTHTLDAATHYAVTQIVQRRGRISLSELQGELKMSERTLERRFKQAVGISPKQLIRIARFQQSLDQLRQNQYDKFSDVAYGNDYADQSHFIRVFKEFTGFTPLEFRRQVNEVVQNFPEVK